LKTPRSKLACSDKEEKGEEYAVEKTTIKILIMQFSTVSHYYFSFSPTVFLSTLLPDTLCLCRKVEATPAKRIQVSDLRAKISKKVPLYMKHLLLLLYSDYSGRGQLKCDGTPAETRFRISAKRTSPFKSAVASVQSTTDVCASAVVMLDTPCSVVV
jgi:hypothetical protein